MHFIECFTTTYLRAHSWLTGYAAHADRMAVGWQFFSYVGTNRHKSLPSHTMNSHADAHPRSVEETNLFSVVSVLDIRT